MYQTEAIAPLAVLSNFFPLPPSFAVYADVFNVFLIGVIPSTFFARELELAALLAIFVDPFFSFFLLIFASQLKIG